MWHSVSNGGSRNEVDEEGGLWLNERQRLGLEDSTFCLRTLKFTDTLEVVQPVRRLHRMEKRHSHKTTNAESESERSLREP